MRDQSVQTKKQKTIHVSLGDQKCHHRHRWKSNDWQREFSVGRIDDQLQQRESNRNVMNGCHLAVGRSRIDRWYITTLERPNRTDRPAFNRHDSSLGLFLNYITTTSPIFIFFFSGKAIQWKEKWIYWTRELLRRKWNIFFFYWAVVIHQRKEFRFFSPQIDGDHWKSWRMAPTKVKPNVIKYFLYEFHPVPPPRQSKCASSGNSFLRGQRIHGLKLRFLGQNHDIARERKAAQKKINKINSRHRSANAFASPLAT